LSIEADVRKTGKVGEGVSVKTVDQ
jgi:hypothetical protein